MFLAIAVNITGYCCQYYWLLLLILLAIAVSITGYCCQCDWLLLSILQAVAENITGYCCQYYRLLLKILLAIGVNIIASCWIYYWLLLSILLAIAGNIAGFCSQYYRLLLSILQAIAVNNKYYRLLLSILLAITGNITGYWRYIARPVTWTYLSTCEVITWYIMNINEFKMESCNHFTLLIHAGNHFSFRVSRHRLQVPRRPNKTLNSLFFPFPLVKTKKRYDIAIQDITKTRVYKKYITMFTTARLTLII